MSERGSLGPFVLGLAMGAVVGFLFAPEPGDATRAKLTKKLHGLKELAADKAGELMDRVAGEPDEEPAALPSAREELERRLADARRRSSSSRAEGSVGAAPGRCPAPL